MDANELRMAAERLRKWAERHAEDPLATRAEKALIYDTGKIAMAYLSEHPADSDEAITEEWLRSVGFELTETGNLRLEFKKPYGEDTAIFHLQCTDAGNITDCLWEIWVESIECEREGAMLPCEPQTRGAVRRLAAALGIELTETKGPTQ